MSPIPTLSQFYAMLLQEENQRYINTLTGFNTANVALNIRSSSRGSFSTRPSTGNQNIGNSVKKPSADSSIILAPRPADKFASRAIKGIMLGYHNGQKGYRVLNLENEKVFVSRNVQFVEHIFPFRDIPSVEPQVERYKARLVAKGFTQTEGIDYFETFASVAKMSSFRTLLSVAAAKNWTIDQLDVTNAFLHEYLEEDVYMVLPPGYQPSSDIQAQYPGQFGFVHFVNDHTLFTFKNGLSIVTLLVYVDDMVLVGNDLSLLATVKTFLNTHFKVKDLGTLKYFLGMELERSSTDNTIVIPDVSQYRRIVGRLIYLTISRRDISYAVHVLAQFMAAPQACHLHAVFRLLRYIKESEYRSMADTTCELVWLRALLSDLGVPQLSPTVFYCDNISALYIAANLVYHEHTKHIEIDCHLVREKLQNGVITTAYLPTNEQPANLFIKALGAAHLHYLLGKLGVLNLFSPPHLWGDVNNIQLHKTEKKEKSCFTIQHQVVHRGDSNSGRSMCYMSGQIVMENVFVLNAGTTDGFAGIAAPSLARILPVDLALFGGEMLCQPDAFLCSINDVKVNNAVDQRARNVVPGVEVIRWLAMCPKKLNYPSLKFLLTLLVQQIII
ncbi:hypothetical protein AgCh_002907 [Apium graveolens]